VVDADAAASVFDQLVSLLRLRLVPLIGRAGDRARFVDGLTGVCRSIAKNEERCGQSNEQMLEGHGTFLSYYGPAELRREPAVMASARLRQHHRALVFAATK